MDNDARELVKASAEGVTAAALRPFEGFLVAIAGPFAARLQLRRLEAQVQLYKKASEILKREGIEATRVDWKTLVPLIRGAETEDGEDESMSDRWALLLANAAAGDRGQQVLAGFPVLLSELTPSEVAILDGLYGEDPIEWRGMHDVRYRDLHERAGVSENRFAVCLENLARHGLIELRDDVDMMTLTSKFGLPTTPDITATILGRAFVAACTRPPNGVECPLPDD